MSEEAWVLEFIRPNFDQYFRGDVKWALGTSWSKAKGFIKLPEPVQAPRSIFDLFFPHAQDSTVTRHNFSTQDNRLVIFIGFDLVTEEKSVKRLREEDPSEASDLDMKADPWARATYSDSVVVKQEVHDGPLIDPERFNSPEPEDDDIFTAGLLEDFNEISPLRACSPQGEEESTIAVSVTGAGPAKGTRNFQKKRRIVLKGKGKAKDEEGV